MAAPSQPTSPAGYTDLPPKILPEPGRMGAVGGTLEEQLARRFRYEHALTLASQALRQAPDLPTGLRQVLDILLEASQSDRVYIFENVEDPVHGLCSNQTYECCQPGIPPQIDNPDLKNLPYSVVSPSGFLLEHFHRREPVRGPVSRLPGPEREILEMQQIVDILILPIFAGSHFWGFLGFDDCARIGAFDDNDVALLQSTADIVGWHVAAQRVNAELEQRVAARTADLAARNHEMLGLLGAIPDTVLLCDHDGRILSAYLPRPEDRPSFIAAADEAHLDTVPCVREIVAAMLAALRNQRQSYVREFDFGGDRQLSLEARANPVGDDRMLVLLRDISARRQNEREVAANLARERQLSEMKAQFVAVASHEFRTPLTSAIGSIDMLERYAERLAPEKRVELVTRIKKSLNRLSGIMQNITNAHLAEIGHLEIAWQSIDIAAFLTEIVKQVEERDRGQHRFCLETPAAATAIRSDVELLTQVFAHLLTNATLYSPPGTTIRVTLARAATEVVVAVSDEGIGIPQEEWERVFEPFVRGGNIGVISGLGLGLTIVKRHVERLGGRVAVRPSERGATLEVRLPTEGSAD